MQFQQAWLITNWTNLLFSFNSWAISINKYLEKKCNKNLRQMVTLFLDQKLRNSKVGRTEYYSLQRCRISQPDCHYSEKICCCCYQSLKLYQFNFQRVWKKSYGFSKSWYCITRKHWKEATHLRSPPADKERLHERIVWLVEPSSPILYAL